MRFIDKVIRNWVHCPDKEIRDGCRAMARDAYVVDCQNVCDWLTEKQYNGGFTMSEVCPIAKMPFPQMFFEFTYKPGDFGDRDPASEISIGILFVDNGPHITTYVYNGPPVEEGITDRNLMMALGFFIDFNEDYSPRDDMRPWMAGPMHHAEKAEQDEMLGVAARMMIPPLAAIAFFHCKNIRVVKRERHGDTKARGEFAGQKPAIHTIEVHKGYERVELVGPPAKEGEIVRGAHIVRGHFKKYGADAPLMGKHVGMFFWAMHVAGKGTAPRLKNEYRVHPPHPKHEGECIVNAPTKK